MKGKTHHGGHHNKARKAHGGEVTPRAYNAEGSGVEKEAEERKHGGRVGHKKRHGKDVGHVDGLKPRRHRLDRPGRKRGGAVGSDTHPLSSAARIKPAEGHSADADMEDD